jgi:hypothetical protein
VRETRLLGASVRWLSNEQTYWDGARIWTYDFSNDQVQRSRSIRGRSPHLDDRGLGKGPGHSLVVLPDRKKVAVNVAGDNLIAFLDLERGGVDATLQTGAFPETSTSRRTVSSASYRNARRGHCLEDRHGELRNWSRPCPSRPAAKPHMLRVSPDGREVWVQTADANTNVVLDALDLSVLANQATGKGR